MNKDIKDKVHELFNSTPDNIGVMYGKKTKEGKFTGEHTIIFTVETKKPLGELKEEEILPSYIDINGEKYKTDVLEVGHVKLLSCDASTEATCYDWLNQSNIDDPYHIDNWDYCRPLKGGIQMTSDNLAGYVGTLGMIAVDTATQSLVGVTNNHVVIGNAFYTSERPIVTLENESDDTAYQEYIGVEEYIGVHPNIGKVIRYIPINMIPGINTVDGALVSVASDDIDIAESFKQFGLSYNLPMVFATTEEIDELIDDNPPLYNSGRTTGAKEGSPCGLIYIGELDGNVGPYWNGYYNSLVTFHDLIVFARENIDCPWPIYKGDSGSVLIADYSGTWKIIGLCLAGSTNYGLACRIDNVATQLGIEAWDGSAKNYIDFASQDIITVTGTSSDATIVCDGKTYWQIGSGLTNNPCIT
jgi:hypothetical protein